MKTSFYTREELKEIGFAAVGRNVLISRKCSIYAAEKMTLGDNIRIDDFCILSGKIEMANYIHVSAYAALYGGAGIKVSNFCNISARVTLWSTSDSFSGEHLVSPLVPPELTNVIRKPIILHDFVTLGSGVTVLPGVVFAEGTAVGACTLVTKSTKQWSIYTGTPARFFKKRSESMKSLSEKFLSKEEK